MRAVILFFFWRIGGILERLNRQASVVGTGEFFDRLAFFWVSDIEANWRAIRAEVEQLLLQRARIPNLQDISEEMRWLTQDDQWKTYMMIVGGEKVEGNYQRCPKTMETVERIPGLCTAIFSILGPGKHLPTHRGYFNGMLRYHLGLIVPGPADACRIRVGNEVRAWQEGKSIIFDDTYPHEVWNDSQSDRVVLYVDFLRPMKFPMPLVSKAFIALFSGLFMKEGEKRIRAWEERYIQLTASSHSGGEAGHPTDHGTQDAACAAASMTGVLAHARLARSPTPDGR